MAYSIGERTATRQAVLVIGTILALTGAWQGVRIATDHLGSAWADHAKWHALVGGLFLVLLSAMLLLGLWGPFRAGRPGSTLLVALLLVGPGAMVLLGMALLPAGAPGGSDTGLAVVATGIGLLTAVLAWRART